MRITEHQLRGLIQETLLSEAFGGGEADTNWDEKVAEREAARIAKEMKKKKRPISWHKSLTLDQMLDPTYNDQWTPETEHNASRYTVPGLYQVTMNGDLYRHILPYDNEGFPAVQALASLIADPSVRGIEPTGNSIAPAPTAGKVWWEDVPGRNPLVMKKDVTKAVKEIAAVGTPEAMETAAEVKQDWRPGWHLDKFNFWPGSTKGIDDDPAARRHVETALERWRGK